MVAKITIMAITIISSSNVKPEYSERCRKLCWRWCSVYMRSMLNQFEENKQWFYQSAYLLLSIPVPVDLLYTSKTSWPPQECESVSSCAERSPQSVDPVM